jgi:hypothetical protein
VREFQADAAVLDPDDGGLEPRSFAKAKFDHFPQVWLEIAADLRATARQVQDLDTVRVAFADDARGFAFEAMAIACAMISAARLRTRNPHSVQGVVFALGARVLVSDNQWLLFAVKYGGTEAVTRGLDTHEATN